MGFGAGSAARFASAGGLALFLCWQHVQAVRLGYRVEAARKLEVQRREEVTSLRLSLEQDLSPAVVSERASKLGLVPAAPDALRRLPPRRRANGFLGLRWAARLSPSDRPRG